MDVSLTAMLPEPGKYEGIELVDVSGGLMTPVHPSATDTDSSTDVRRVRSNSESA